jgi:hypothetical protein
MNLEMKKKKPINQCHKPTRPQQWLETPCKVPTFNVKGQPDGPM